MTTSAQAVAGLIELRVDGQLVQAAGSFTWNLGKPKREMLVGSDATPHGTRETPQVPFIKGTIRAGRRLNVAALVGGTNQTVTLKLPNAHTVILRNADFCGEGTAETADGTIEVEWQGLSGEELRS